MRYPLLLLLSATVLPMVAEEEPMLSGAHLSYTALFSGQVKADGRTNDWDDGFRIDVHFRDYYFETQSHHPFAEIGLFYENHSAGGDGFDIDTETFALRGAVGSAIPLWRTFDGLYALGVAPELGAHIGTFGIDVNSAGLHSDDNSFRYGASAGFSGWLLYNRSLSFGVGLVGSYWGATSVTLTAPDGLGGSESHSTSPSGWDLGARFSVGFLF